jgi:aspartate aminotransferase
MTQYAAIPALEGEADKDIEMMRAEFEKRKNYIVKAINEIDGLSCYEPDGAFYVFINIKKISNDSMKFCADLLEQKGVALVPGLAFGMEGYARFSFATSLEVIKEGVKRIKEFTQK